MPESMISALVTLPLPEHLAPPPERSFDPIAAALFAEHGIEVPIFGWPTAQRRWFRISAQLYNAPEDYEALARALTRA